MPRILGALPKNLKALAAKQLDRFYTRTTPIEPFSLHQVLAEPPLTANP